MTDLPGPLRRLAWATLVTNLGNGAWYTSWAVFLTRSVGLSPSQAGVGMTIAGAAGIGLAVPMGHLADRRGPRGVLAMLLAAQTAGMLAYLLVHGMVAFVVVATVTTAASRAGTGVRAALICGFVEGEARLRVLGVLRTVNHIGFAVGAAVGGLVIGLSTHAAFTALVLLDAGTFAAYAAIVAAMPAVAARRRGDDGPALAVLRDGPYVTLATLMGVLALCWAMLSSGLPLWVVAHTDAPTWISGVIVLVSSVGIAALQVRATRLARRPLDAARTAVCAGAALAVSCLLFAATDGLGGAPAIVLLLAAGVAHVVGELLFVAASWGLSIPLMPEDAPGQYQGMFATGEAAATMAGPALMTTLVVGWGQPGWLVLGGVFLLAMAPTVPVTHWALRTRAGGPVTATAG